MKKHWGKGLALILMLSLVLAGCASGGQAKGGKISLAYVAWDSEIASTHVVKHILQDKLGYEVEMLQVDAGPMWTGVADGSADAMVAAWLPVTHASYFEKNESKIEDLGSNLEGTKLGLVVPSYMDIQSIEDLSKDEVGAAVDYKVIGIEPGAGIMMSTEKALEDYGLKDKWNLVESSSAAMATELQKAYDKQEPIIITGWTPHWMFAKMDLKYLDDPKNVYGDEEQIHTIARKGLKDDEPKAYQFLDQFQWTPEDMAEVMVDIQEGTSPDDAAVKWIEANDAKVQEWLAGVE